MWDWIRGRTWGLSGRLAASYVLVTLTVVALTEALALGFRAGLPPVTVVTTQPHTTVAPPSRFTNPFREWNTIRQWAIARPLVTASDLVLLCILPMGVLFGLLASRRLVSRIRQLEAATLAVADGDYAVTLPASGRDEIGRLEMNFLVMARQLSSATAAERARAANDARAVERARIARELHDSISQHLFGLRMIAGGMRRADPSDEQAEAIEQIAEEAIREMHLLLLEIGPFSVNSDGLVPALDRLCAAYRDRLGLNVVANLDVLSVPEPVGHAMLRIAQEACANAVRHGHAQSLAVSMKRQNGQLKLAVRDNGTGFDPTAAHPGSGLKHIRQRATEIGGDLTIQSSPGVGALVAVQVPAP